MVDLSVEKQREIEVGQLFVGVFNGTQGTEYELDGTYWNSERDPSPDLRFVANKQPILFAEVVSFDEDGAQGFLDHVRRGQWMDEVQEALKRNGATGFDVGIWLSGIPENTAQRRFLANSLVDFAMERASDTRSGRFRWKGDEVRASWSILFNKLDQMFVSLKEGAAAGCVVGGPAKLIDPAQGLAEALERKELKRYGQNTHLLIDNKSSLVDSDDLSRGLDGKPVILPSFAGVWFVTLRSRDVLPLHSQP